MILGEALGFANSKCKAARFLYNKKKDCKNLGLQKLNARLDVLFTIE